MKSDKIVTLFPNPVTDYLIVTSYEPITDIKVFDAFGQIIEMQEVIDIKTVKFETKSYKSGMYIVQVSGIGYSESYKIIVL